MRIVSRRLAALKAVMKPKPTLHEEMVRIQRLWESGVSTPEMVEAQRLIAEWFPELD